MWRDIELVGVKQHSSADDHMSVMAPPGLKLAVCVSNAKPTKGVATATKCIARAVPVCGRLLLVALKKNEIDAAAALAKRCPADMC